jgi:SAM-dependent methyltransferase
MTRPEWAPEDVDVDIPSASRMYDYYLGGCHNFAADRELAERALAVMPDGRRLAQVNRAFLRRAVRFCAEAGVDQFLDLGSGIPTLGNVHEVAQQASPGARTVYVDTDPVAVAHSQAILAGNDRATVIQHDLRRPEEILADPRLRGQLDLTRPVALLAVAVLHFVQDDADPAGVLARFRAALPSGSMLVISHGTDENRPEDAAKVVALYRGTANPLKMRSRAEVSALFDGWELVEPGLVCAPLWRPDSPEEIGEHPEAIPVYAGAAYKP